MSVLLAALALAGFQKEAPRVQMRLEVLRNEGAFLPNVTLTNRGKADALLLRQGDGSEVGWRSPAIGWGVVNELHPGEMPTKPNYRYVRMCGNINLLTEDEFYTLKPGESTTFEPRMGDAMLFRTGSNRVSFFYRSDPNMELHDDWRSMSPALLKRLRSITPLDLKSNEVFVQVGRQP